MRLPVPQLRSHMPRWAADTELIVFAGGYGGDSYVRALSVFCAAATSLRHASSSSSFGFVFSPHPGYPSSYEEGLFTRWGCLTEGGNLKVVRPKQWGGVTTAQLVSVAKASASMDSTVGAQSLAIGVPHVYVSDRDDVWTRMGLISNALTPESLVGVLNVTFRARGFRAPTDAMARVGVPPNGTAIMEERLRSLLRRDAIP